MRKSKYSIIVPARNVASTISACLSSILGQTFRNFELIVVDNQSTDGTAALAAGVGQSRLLACSGDGAGRARNYGARSAVGEYLVFVDADVTLPSNWLRELNHLIDAYEWVDCFAGCVKPISRSNRLLFDLRHWKFHFNTGGTGSHLERFRNSRPLVNSSLFAIKRETFEQMGGFDESMQRCEDNLLTEKLISSGRHIFVYSGLQGEVSYASDSLSGYIFRSMRNGYWANTIPQTKVSSLKNLVLSSTDSFAYFKKYARLGVARLVEIFGYNLGTILSWCVGRKPRDILILGNQSNEKLSIVTADNLFCLSPSTSFVLGVNELHVFVKGECAHSFASDSGKELLRLFGPRVYTLSQTTLNILKELAQSEAIKTQLLLGDSTTLSLIYLAKSSQADVSRLHSRIAPDLFEEILIVHPQKLSATVFGDQLPGARVLTFEGDGDQVAGLKNFAIAQAKCDMIFWLEENDDFDQQIVNFLHIVRKLPKNLLPSAFVFFYDYCHRGEVYQSTTCFALFHRLARPVWVHDVYEQLEFRDESISFRYTSFRIHKQQSPEAWEMQREEDFQKLLTLKSDPIHQAFYLAPILEQKSEILRARELWYYLLQQTGQKFSAYRYVRATILGEIETATSDLERIVEAHFSPEAEIFLGVRYFRERNYESCSAIFLRALREQGPSFLLLTRSDFLEIFRRIPLSLLALSYRAQERPQEAEKFSRLLFDHRLGRLHKDWIYAMD